MRIFLSFNSKDVALAEAIRAGLTRLEPAAKVFFSPISLGSGLWLPKLADEIAEADAFLLLIGPKGVGPWQKVEYFTAFDRHVNEQAFALVPVLVSGAAAPGLPFLRTLNWVEAPVVTEDEALHQVLAALNGEAPTTATPLWKLVHPYRGLEAMTEANADYFFGRVGETAAVLNALAGKPDRFAVLIGASGVGKSSVAQAGVMSALKAMRWPGSNGAAATPWPAALRNSRNWISLNMRPGSAPLEALAGAFVALWGLDAKDPDSSALPRKWAKGLAAGENKLADLIGATQDELKKQQGEAPERLLIYLDQGEELYIRATQAEAHRFSELLAEGLGDNRLFAFASLRADYFDRFQADEPLFKSHEHVNVPPLDRAQLEDVVTEPAQALGVAFEDGKIADIITDAAAAAPGALPLLSYLLTDMWSEMVKRDKPVLGLPAQAIDIGGVLASRADAFLNENPGDERALRRLLTLKLAIVPAEGEPVRRQTFREECTEAEWALASRLTDYPYRLVVMGERGSDGQIVAEVAHEAFLRAWPRLTHWLREEREFLVFKSEVEHDERRWHALGRPNNALLSGLDLARAEEWLAKRPEDLSDRARIFVQQSIATDRTEKERRLRFQRRVSIAGGISALVMAAISLFAWYQWLLADTAKNRATTAESAANAALVVARATSLGQLAGVEFLRGNIDAALRFSVQGVRIDLGLPVGTTTVFRAATLLATVLAQADLRLTLREHETVFSAAFSPSGIHILTASEDKTARIWDAVTGNEIKVLRGHQDIVLSAAFSPDGTRIATASADGTARIWDAATGNAIKVLRGHENYVLSVAFSPDGTRIVTASEDDTARIWDSGTGDEIRSLRGHEYGVTSAAFSPDGTRVVTASWDKTARIWDATTGNEIKVLRGHGSDVDSAAFSRDGTRIVTASADKTVRVWNVAGNEIKLLRGYTSPVYSAAFSPDGTRIVVASNNNTVPIWDAATGNEIKLLRGHWGVVNSAVFSPDGRRVVTASDDYTARIWDAAGNEIMVLRGHERAVRSAAFSPDGRRVVTASDDHTARIWDAATGNEIMVLRGHEDVIHSAAFSPDGARIVTASADKTARIWDAATGNGIMVLHGPEARLASAAFSPDGARIVTALEDKTARIWDAATGSEIRILQGHEDVVYSAAFSPDGTRIVTASWDRTARIWDATTGEEIRVLRGHEDPVGYAAFSPDGTRIITASADNSVRIWDAANGNEIKVLRGHEGVVNAAAFSPDGTRIITASRDKTALIWDAATGNEIAVLRGHEVVYSAAFSPDGTRIVTASADKTAHIWDAATGNEIMVLHGHLGSVNSAAFSPDGTRVVTASDDRTARIWDATTGTEIEVLRRHEGVVNSAAFSPDGTRIATASADGSARIWDAVTGNEIKVLRGDKADVHSAAFSPDGTRIVTASGDPGEDGTARIWDVGTGNEIRVLRGHRGDVNSAAFSPNGTRIITAAWDHTVRIWDATTGNEIEVLHGHESAVTSAVFSPDGMRIVTASKDETVRVWDAHLATMSTEGLLVEACARRLFGLSKLSRDEMHLLGYADAQPVIDVCEGVE